MKIDREGKNKKTLKMENIWNGKNREKKTNNWNDFLKDFLGIKSCTDSCNFNII